MTPSASSLTRARLAAVCLVALGTFAASCGDDSAPSSSPAAQSSPATEADTAATAAPATEPGDAVAEGSGSGSATLVLDGQTFEFLHVDEVVPCMAQGGTGGFIIFSGTNAAGEVLDVEWSADYPEDADVWFADQNETTVWAAGPAAGTPLLDVTIPATGSATVIAQVTRLYTGDASTASATIDIRCG